ARHDRDPRRAGRDRAARKRARLGTAAGPADRGRARRRPFLPPPAAPDPRHHQAPVESLTATQVLRVTGLRKSYGANEVVAGTSLAIARGECFGLLGPNGAGKTTTLRLCLGLIEPDA